MTSLDALCSGPRARQDQIQTSGALTPEGRWETLHGACVGKAAIEPMPPRRHPHRTRGGVGAVGALSGPRR